MSLASAARDLLLAVLPFVSDNQSLCFLINCFLFLVYWKHTLVLQYNSIDSVVLKVRNESIVVHSTR